MFSGGSSGELHIRQNVAMSQPSKTCKECRAALPLSAFPILSANHKHGPRCRECHNAKQRAYVDRARTTKTPAVEGIRICKSCQQIRHMTEFPIQFAATDGRMALCKFCENARQRTWRKAAMASRPDFVAARQLSQDKHKAQRYGLTLEAYRELEAKVTGKCEVCHKPPRCRKQWRADSRLHIDHCHKTGKVRGLLCTDCNRAIGLFEDDPAALFRAAEYVRREPK